MKPNNTNSINSLKLRLNSEKPLTQTEILEVLTLLQRTSNTHEKQLTNDFLRKVSEQKTNFLEYLDQLAALALSIGQPSIAADLYRYALSINPTNQNLLFNLAWYLEKSGDHNEALNNYDILLAMYPDNQEDTHLNMAKILAEQLHREEEALHILTKLIERKPNYSPALYNLGNIYEQIGDKKKSQDFFAQALKANPNTLGALARIAGTMTFNNADDIVIKKMHDALASDRLNYDDAVDLHYALGTAYDQCRKFILAGVHFKHANDLNALTSPPYDTILEHQKIKATKAAFTEKIFSKNLPTNVKAPIFICGLFRSGSTLCEQILSQHENLQSIGESDFFLKLRSEIPTDRVPSKEEISKIREKYTKTVIEKLGKGKRITDKRPDNLISVGLIKLIHPNAKIIITQRNLRDNALSIYFQRLGSQLNYSCDLTNIEQHAKNQKDLINHWLSLFPDDILVLHYEELVKDPARSVKNLLDFLNEPFDEKCLKFHESTRAVKTASVWQVRNPIYKSSMERWKNYTEVFPELLKMDMKNVDI